MGNSNDKPIFIPYKVNESFANLYYQVPVELFINPLYKDKLNSDSKLLYALLINRLNLSMTNNWVDEDGNVYLIFSRKEAEEVLCLSENTVTKAFKILKDLKLISEKRQGKTKHNLIYVGKINNAKVSRKIYGSRTSKNEAHEPQDLQVNNKYKNKYNNYIYNKPFDNRFHDPNNQITDYSKYYYNFEKERVDNRFFDPNDQYSDITNLYANM